KNESLSASWPVGQGSLCRSLPQRSDRDPRFDSLYKAGVPSPCRLSRRPSSFLAQLGKSIRDLPRQLQVPQDPENRGQNLPVLQPQGRRGGRPEGCREAPLLAQ